MLPEVCVVCVFTQEDQEKTTEQHGKGEATLKWTGLDLKWLHYRQLLLLLLLPIWLYFVVAWGCEREADKDHYSLWFVSSSHIGTHWSFVSTSLACKCVVNTCEYKRGHLLVVVSIIIIPSLNFNYGKSYSTHWIDVSEIFYNSHVPPIKTINNNNNNNIARQ